MSLTYGQKLRNISDLLEEARCISSHIHHQFLHYLIDMAESVTNSELIKDGKNTSFIPIDKESTSQ